MSDGTAGEGDRAVDDASRRSGATPLRIPRKLRRGGEMSPAQRAFYRFMWWVVQVIGRSYFRLRVVGGEQVPREGAFIISPIHRSNLDTPILAAITRRRIRYMGKESLWKSAAGGWFLSTLGGFPVRRGTADREALRACAEVLERGEPLVMFPEGTRQSGPRTAPFFAGPAYVALRSGVPIVPVGIGGSERAMPKGAKMARPTRVVLVVGPPLHPPELPEGGRVPRRAVRELTEQLRDEIQVLFDEAQALVGDPNRHEAVPDEPDRPAADESDA